MFTLWKRWLRALSLKVSLMVSPKLLALVRPAPLPSDLTQRRPVLGGLLCGVVLGTALQLQQPTLWLGSEYVVILAVSALLASFVATKTVAFSA